MGEKKTGELENILGRARNRKSLDEYLEKEKPESGEGGFTDYFLSLDEVRKYPKAELVRKSGIDRTYCYQILSGRKKPGRDKVLALCLAAGLSLEETQRGLKKAGEAPLYAKNRRDAILLFAVNNHLDVLKTEELLDEYGEKLLK